jgi:DNA-directed RNA polymerase subunit omega
MKQPSLDVLMSNVDSKYTLVVAAAKRARALMANAASEEFKDKKPVSRALEEIAQDKISFDFIKEGSK